MTALSVTIDELKKAGIDHTVSFGGKHMKVKAEGLPLIVCSVSCSDCRGEVQARSLVRRLIRKNRVGVTT